MKNKQSPDLGLQVMYYLPVVSLVEVVAIMIMIGVPSLNNWAKDKLLWRLIIPPIAEHYSIIVISTIIITIVWLGLTFLTIYRQRDNSLSNYLDSVMQTYELRQFSKIQPKIERIKQGNTVQKHKVFGPGEVEYNAAVKGFLIDKQNDTLTAWLALPEAQDGQEIFEKKLHSIISRIKNNRNNQQYTFSPGEYFSGYYRIEASRLNDS